MLAADLAFFAGGGASASSGDIGCFRWPAFSPAGRRAHIEVERLVRRAAGRPRVEVARRYLDGELEFARGRSGELEDSRALRAARRGRWSSTSTQYRSYGPRPYTTGANARSRRKLRACAGATPTEEARVAVLSCRRSF